MGKNITLASVIKAFKLKWPDLDMTEKEIFADKIQRLGIEAFKNNIKEKCAPEYPCALRSLENGDRISNYDEIDRLKRCAGILLSVIDMIKTREKSCRNIVDQISSAQSILKEIGKHILLRHIEICIKKKDWPGKDETSRKKELDLTFRKITKYFDEAEILQGLKSPKY